MKNENEHEDILELIKYFPRVKASPDFVERLFRRIAAFEPTGDKDFDIKVALIRERLKEMTQNKHQDLSKRVNGSVKR